MNKTEFIKELAIKLSYPEEKCIRINDILENNFFLSKQKKDVIIKELISKLEIDKKEAETIYEGACSIIKEEVKQKLKHPLQGRD